MSIHYSFPSNIQYVSVQQVMDDVYGKLFQHCWAITGILKTLYSGK